MPVCSAVSVSKPFGLPFVLQVATLLRALLKWDNLAHFPFAQPKALFASPDARPVASESAPALTGNISTEIG